MFSTLYKNLRKQSDERSLKEKGIEVFQINIQKDLDKYFFSVDEDSGVIVVWNSDDLQETLRALSADYSIDIGANGVELDCIGKAHLNKQGQIGASLTCYRNQERGTNHDYIDRIDVASYNEAEFVKSLVSSVKKVWDEAFEDIRKDKEREEAKKAWQERRNSNE